jgi:hypothetical protein
MRVLCSPRAEFRATQHAAAANQLVNQLYIGVCAASNAADSNVTEILWTI